jgi:hypothetical protein
MRQGNAKWRHDTVYINSASLVLIGTELADFTASITKHEDYTLATMEQTAPTVAKAKGGRPRTNDIKIIAVREMMTRFETAAEIKFTPQALIGSAANLLEACKRFEISNKIKPMIFSISLETFNGWLTLAGYSFPTGRTPNIEKDYWTQLVVKVRFNPADNYLPGLLH